MATRRSKGKSGLVDRSHNLRDVKDLIALRAIELLRFLEMFSVLEELPKSVQSKIKPIADAVNRWRPSMADCDELKQRIKRKGLCDAE